jgi:hypothetical protein
MTAYILEGLIGKGYVTEASHVFYFLCTLHGNTLRVEHFGTTIDTAIQNRGDPMQLHRDSEQTPAIPGYNATPRCSEHPVHMYHGQTCVRKQRVTTISFICHSPSVDRLT